VAEVWVFTGERSKPRRSWRHELDVPANPLGVPPGCRHVASTVTALEPRPPSARGPLFTLDGDYSTISVTVNELESEPEDPVTVKV
jgi:hypothetical protein